jgi:hypothetical protein
MPVPVDPYRRGTLGENNQRRTGLLFLSEVKMASQWLDHLLAQRAAHTV